MANSSQLIKFMGKKIKTKRKEKNMTIEDLALALEVSKSYIALIERGERGFTINMLLKICEVFDLSVEEFFSDDILVFREDKVNAEREKKVNLINNLLRTMDMTQLDFILDMLRSLGEMKKNSLRKEINNNYIAEQKIKAYKKTAQKP